MTNPVRLLVFSSLVLAMGAAASSKDSPEAAAKRTAEELYTFHMAHDMGFAPETLALRAHWLTPELLALAKAYFARPHPHDEAPVIDGDPFTNAQDTPRRFSVAPATLKAGEARVEITFFWDADPKTTATLVLRQRGDAWLVDDITYPEGSSFRQLLLSPPD